jgi:mono/diheme cytochrome c family protein
MNTTKQVNVMIGLLFVGLFGTLLYFIWENGVDVFGVEIASRQDVAAVRQEQTNVERGAHLYALNCRSCHGLTGQGAIERGGLPGAPLNVESNRPPELTGGQLVARANRFNDTIHCGRVGTVMPPWSTEQGGPLNFFQIEQLVLLITSAYSEEGWEFAVEEANHADAFTIHKELVEPIGVDDDEIRMNNAIGLSPSTPEAPLIIRIGGDTLDEPYELFLVTGIDQDTATLEVERGTDPIPLSDEVSIELGTEAIEHEEGAEVYNGPVAPGTTITGDPEAQGDPPCGQSAAAPAEDGGDGGEAVALAEVEAIEMSDNFFAVDDAQNPGFSLPVGTSATTSLNNVGNAVHNLRTAGVDGEYETDDDHVSTPDLITAGGTATITISFTTAGTYDYRCDFHPTEMVGEITVQ